MKLRHLLFGLLAGVAFVACTNDDDPAGASPVNGGDKVATAPKYMKVNFVMPGASTRGDAEDQAGTKEESLINDAVFLFFKGGAQVADPFGIKPGGVDAVDANGPYSSQKDSNWDGESAVVVLDNPSDIPTSLVVLINVDLKVMTGKDYKQDGSISDDQKAVLKTKTIDNLQAAVESEIPTAKGPFKMTNAVYNDANGNTIIGTPVAADNVCETPDAARGNAVQVNVERVVAKVSVDNTATTTTPASSGVRYNNKDVKIALLGWDLVYENTRSYLIKKLVAEYALPTTFTWNDATNKRSYWATSAEFLPEKDNNGKVLGPTYNAIPEGFGNSVYTHENTEFFNDFKEPTKGDAGIDYPTQNPIAVIVKAKLQDAEGNPLDLYKWSNTLLSGADLKTILFNTLNKNPKYYKKVGDAFFPLEPNDFILKTDASVGFDYQANAYLNTTLETVYTDIKKDPQTGELSGNEVSQEDANNDLANYTELVEYWNGGATYYYVPIKQHSKVDGVEGDADVFGVVRNNFYKLTITSVKGLGTAVPDPNAPILPDTPDPDTSKYYIAAKIQVLKWNLVKQEVHLGEQ